MKPVKNDLAFAQMRYLRVPVCRAYEWEWWWWWYHPLEEHIMVIWEHMRRSSGDTE